MPETIYNNFLNLPPELSNPDTSGAMILPLPLDLTASWKRGTDAGPQAIIAASHHIEYFDEELGFTPVERLGGIATYPELEFPKEPAAAADAIRTIAAELIREGRMLVALGGEHSITHPLVQAHRRKWPDLCVLQIDAHADLRDEYMGSAHNHACPMRRILEMGIHVTAVGVRSVDETEAPLLDGPLRKTFLDIQTRDCFRDFIPRIIESLPGNHVYLTVDLDGLDPAIAPAVGTPVPGGLSWYDTLALVRSLSREKTVVGADVVELMPREDLHGTDSLAARLVYKIITYGIPAQGK